MEQGGLRIKNQSKYRKISSKPLISVITVVFNGGKTLERTINCVISQTYDNIEYIIIDGKSTDNSLEIINKYEDFIDYWISESDKGIADAFNKGFSVSTGDYIGFINSDDWYEKEGISQIVQEINSEDSIYCGHLNLFSGDQCKFVKLHKSKPERILQTMRIAQPSTFVSRDVFNRLGGFSLNYEFAMDYDFFLRAFLSGYKIKIVDKIIANQRMGGKTSNLLKVYKEELMIKNTLLGCKIKHWIWYFSNVILFFPLKVINRFK
jgi:glycosyltransferase involved in cell wall biosynthesis